MPEAPSQRRFLIAMMLFVIVVINYLDRSNISIVGPQLSRTLNLTPVKLGIVLSGFGWTRLTRDDHPPGTYKRFDW
jgi:ACS family D-galactonate transporter-like MFS transporter